MRLVRPVDPDDAAAGPIGQRGGARARSERDRPVEGVMEVGEPLTDVEAAVRGWPAPPADPDLCVEDGLAGPVKREHEAFGVDNEPRLDGMVGREGRAPDPSLPALRDARQRDAHPRRAPALRLYEDAHEVRYAVGGGGSNRADNPRARGRLGPGIRRMQHIGPAGTRARPDERDANASHRPD